MKLMLYLILFLLRESFILSEIRRKVNRSANKTQTCGKSAYVSGGRIVDGRPARDGEFPWQISIYGFNTNYADFCGGSIIDQKTILTAAHCVQGKDTVSVVRYNSLYSESGGTVITNCRIIIHPNFNNQTGENDIAIIKPSQPLVLGLLNSGTVCLPTNNSDPKPGTVLRVSGWGQTQLDGNQPLKLMTTLVTVRSRDECRATYGELGAKITQKMICALGNQSGICNGDSGGPLVDYSSGRAVIIGIVSGTYFCGLDSVPDFYTRVNSYLDWINKYKS